MGLKRWWNHHGIREKMYHSIGCNRFYLGPEHSALTRPLVLESHSTMPPWPSQLFAFWLDRFLCLLPLSPPASFPRHVAPQKNDLVWLLSTSDRAIPENNKRFIIIDLIVSTLAWSNTFSLCSVVLEVQPSSYSRWLFSTNTELCYFRADYVSLSYTYMIPVSLMGVLYKLTSCNN